MKTSDEPKLAVIASVREQLDGVALSLFSMSNQLADAARREAHQPAIGQLRMLIKQRRRREKFFSASLFSDPAWDILLDLALARFQNIPVAVLSLCIAANVPQTTALRWITGMLGKGLLIRRPDARDGRRVYVDLSDTAFNAMCGYLADVARSDHRRG